MRQFFSLCNSRVSCKAAFTYSVHTLLLNVPRWNLIAVEGETRGYRKFIRTSTGYMSCTLAIKKTIKNFQSYTSYDTMYDSTDR